MAIVCDGLPGLHGTEILDAIRHEDVHTHVVAVTEKLGVDDRSAAASEAMRRGIIL